MRVSQKQNHVAFIAFFHLKVNLYYFTLKFLKIFKKQETDKNFHNVAKQSQCQVPFWKNVLQKLPECGQCLSTIRFHTCKLCILYLATVFAAAVSKKRFSRFNKVSKTHSPEAMQQSPFFCFLKNWFNVWTAFWKLSRRRNGKWACCDRVKKNSLR